MKHKKLLATILSVLSAICWRIGGRGGFDNAKLIRRVGTPVCTMLTIMMFTTTNWLLYAIAMILLTWGSCSYFGWINYVVEVWWKDIDIEREYCWNFLAEALVMQSCVLLFMCNIWHILIVIFVSALAAFGKVAIDNTTTKNKDVYSELYFGGLMTFGIFINLIVG